MKKTITLALALLLCLVLPVLALAQVPECKNPEHSIGDGLDHNRPQSCWVTGHNNCDGLNHARAACGTWAHYNCDGRDHSAAPCGAAGHYACDKLNHEAASCGVAGHCTQDGKSHGAAACGIPGHYNCDGQKHQYAACGTVGHYSCDGQLHQRAACGVKGHYTCDGDEHVIAACGKSGHCISDAKTHEPAACGIAGHYTCDGKTHELADCGVADHYACDGRKHYHDKVISKYCNASPQHKVCEGDQQHYCDPAYGGCGDTYWCSKSNAHTACRMCGLLWCDRTLGSHETPCNNANHRPCVYKMQGKTYVKEDHELCHLCGEGKCSGEHGNGVCVPTCGACGMPEKFGLSHFLEGCKHNWCVTPGSHDWCDECKTFKCDEKCPH